MKLVKLRTTPSMRNLQLLVGLIFLILLGHNEAWNFCYKDQEEKMCGEDRHIVCYKDDIQRDGTFLDKAPMTYRLMDTLLKKINSVRNDIAGGLQLENDTSFPPAAHMRELQWDNELEFFAVHRSKVCTMVRSACSATPKYNQASEVIGMYGQDSKPIRFDVAFEHIFNDVLDQGRNIDDKSVFGVDYTPDLAMNAPDLTVLANDKASRVGCSIALCTDCNAPGGIVLAFCYHLTCVFDVANIEGCPIYKPSQVVSATKCEKVFGGKPSKHYKNLCANDGTLIKKIECDGPPDDEAEPEYSADEDAEFWGKWMVDVAETPRTNAPNTIEADIGFARFEYPPAPRQKSFARDSVMERLPADNPDKLCARIRGKELTKEAMKYCPFAEYKYQLRHIACNFPHFSTIGDVVGLYWPNSYEKQYLLDLHNQIRDSIASGNEYSEVAGKKYPSASRMRELIWDEELEWLAMWQVKHCVYSHDKCRSTDKFPIVGQNLAQVSLPSGFNAGLPYVAYTGMKLFYLEKNNVSDPELLPSYYDREVNLKSEKVGHYSQIVVDKVSRIGCAFSFCDNYFTEKNGTFTDQNKKSSLMACHYDSMTLYNISLYKIGTPTSNCQDFGLGVSSNYANLCAASTDRGKQMYIRDIRDPLEGTELEVVNQKISDDCGKRGFTDCPKFPEN